MTTTTAFFVLCGALLVNGAFIRRPYLDERISGGTDADIEDHPYQVSLRSNQYELCSAIIISKYWVLTSARCVVYSKVESIIFRAGSSLLNKGGSLHQAEEVIIHENYKGGMIDWDYALIMVDPPFSFGPGVQAIGLADTEPAAGEVAVITGWGTGGKFESSYKEVLQVANVLISDQTTCSTVTPRLICARATEDGKDTCYGDNGGPLVVGGKLVGIGAHDGCGDIDYPSLYSNVANQRVWIKTKTGI